MESETIFIIVIVALFIVGILFSILHRGPDERCSKYRNTTNSSRELRERK